MFDPIRRQWVSKTPEEGIRQQLLHHLINDLGFPPALIVVERGLRQMPHVQIQAQKIPKRRADIVCFGIDFSRQTVPLLLIECKATPITPAVFRQIIGYNFYLKASFIAVVNQSAIRFAKYNDGQSIEHWSESLPNYSKLISH